MKVAKNLFRFFRDRNSGEKEVITVLLALKLGAIFVVLKANHCEIAILLWVAEECYEKYMEPQGAL